MDWSQGFAAWEVVANFVATLLGVWAAVAIESCRSQKRETRSVIRRGIALADEAERYPSAAPIEDVSVLAAAFPLWLRRDQLASDLNEEKPDLGAWVLWRLMRLHGPGSDALGPFTVRAIAEEVRDALRGELERSRSTRPKGWYSEVMQRKRAESLPEVDENLRRLVEFERRRLFPESTAFLAPESSPRSISMRTWLARFRRRREDDGR